jgi:hypothetical protein
MPYVRQVLRQRKLARQLGFWEALHVPWIAEQQKNKLHNVSCIVSNLDIISLGLFIAVVVLITTPGHYIWFYLVGGWRNAFGFLSLISVMLNEYDWILPVVYLATLMTSGAIIVTFLVRRSQERLGLISRLYSSLEGYKEEVKQDKDHHIRIPAEAYEKIAQIERAQIARDRVQSIQSGLDKAGASPYVLQKSHAAQQAQARLDTTTRLRVQDQLDALMTEPHPVGITRDSKAGAFHLRVPETPVIIEFTVNEQAHRIQILSVESTSDAAQSSSELGE